MNSIEPTGGALNEGLEADCPYCGETAPVWFEPGLDQPQEFVQDCPVCCRPLARHGPDNARWLRLLGCPAGRRIAPKGGEGSGTQRCRGPSSRS